MASSWRGRPLGIYVLLTSSAFTHSPANEPKPNSQTHVGPPPAATSRTRWKLQVQSLPSLDACCCTGQSRNASSCGHFLSHAARRLVGNEAGCGGVSPCWPDRGTLGLAAGWAFVGLRSQGESGACGKANRHAPPGNSAARGRPRDVRTGTLFFDKTRPSVCRLIPCCRHGSFNGDFPLKAQQGLVPLLGLMDGTRRWRPHDNGTVSPPFLISISPRFASARVLLAKASQGQPASYRASDEQQ
ncbi:hypothetical protein EDB80DRAFT_141774 [Ilyonectria destructans]|nr:hypothetical protein EDB80DRAFT_141774 [Ilyonectria destructans]